MPGFGRVPQIMTNKQTGEVGYWYTRGNEKFFIVLQKKSGFVDAEQISAWAAALDKAEKKMYESVQKIRKMKELSKKGDKKLIQAYLKAAKAGTGEDLVTLQKRETARYTAWMTKRGMLFRVINSSDSAAAVAELRSPTQAKKKLETIVKKTEKPAAEKSPKVDVDSLKPGEGRMYAILKKTAEKDAARRKASGLPPVKLQYTAKRERDIAEQLLASVEEARAKTEKAHLEYMKTNPAYRKAYEARQAKLAAKLRGEEPEKYKRIRERWKKADEVLKVKELRPDDIYYDPYEEYLQTEIASTPVLVPKSMAPPRKKTPPSESKHERGKRMAKKFKEEMKKKSP
jgi:hypothetical protein